MKIAYPSHAGIDNCTMNILLLKHLTGVVRSWGMLWAYSCFWFESINGQLRNHVYATRCCESGNKVQKLQIPLLRNIVQFLYRFQLQWEFCVVCHY